MLKYGKSELSKVVEVLEAEHETVGDAAQAVLALLEVIFAARAKFVVVGQLSATAARPSIPPSDAEAIALCLDWFSTEGDARKAAESLWHSAVTGDVFQTRILPMHHGSPADLHGKRKAQLAAEADKRAEASAERGRALAAKRDQEAAERAVWWRLECLCSHERIDHRNGNRNEQQCRSFQCGCTEFIEQKASTAA